jgi:hypothetical protein
MSFMAFSFAPSAHRHATRRLAYEKSRINARTDTSKKPLKDLRKLLTGKHFSPSPGRIASHVDPHTDIQSDN